MTYSEKERLVNGCSLHMGWIRARVRVLNLEFVVKSEIPYLIIDGHRIF